MSKQINWHKKFDNSNHAIAIFDYSLNLIDFNSAFSEFNNNEALKSINHNLFITSDPGIHSWDFNGCNFFVTKESFDDKYVLTFLDITNYMEMLDQVIDQRINIMSNSKIDHGNEIVSQVSHCILNPSFIIKANLNQLQKNIVDETQLKHLSRIDQSIKRIIDFSQAVSMNLIKKDDTSSELLSNVIENVLNYYKEDCKIYEIEFITENICEKLMINSAVKFALISIIENAVEELQRKGKDWIKISYHHDERDILEISNSGPIISVPERVQLFKRPQTNKIDGKHSGFSLFTAANLLNAKNAQIEYFCDKFGTFKVSF